MVSSIYEYVDKHKIPQKIGGQLVEEELLCS